MRHRDGYSVGSSAEVIDVKGVSSATMATLVRAASAPILGADLKRLAAAHDDGDAVLQQLLEAGCIIESQAAGPSRAGARKVEPLVDTMVWGLTGSNGSALQLPAIVSLMPYVRAIEVIATPAARRFIVPRTLETYGLRVWSSPYDVTQGMRVPHVQLAEAAGAVLVWPATAHTIARLARGACSDLLSLVVAATRAPVVVVPSMNAAMWENPAIQRNVWQLVEDGIYVIEPRLGGGLAGLRRAELGELAVAPEAMIPLIASIIRRSERKADSASGQALKRRRRSR